MEKSKQEQSNKESIAVLKALRDKFYDKFPDLNSQDIIVEKSNQLKSKYPDYLDYEAYHVLISSTPHIQVKHLDFPGEDSIESFFQYGN